MSSNRVFYTILERVGGKGRHQNISLMVWSAIMLVVGASSFFNAFLFYQDPYQCPEDISNCQDYVCSLPHNERALFLVNDLYSIGSKFGDFRCEGGELDRMQTFIYMGGVIGIIAGAFISEYLTKRKLIFITVIGSFIGNIFAVFAPSLFLTSIGLFLNFASITVQMEIIVCYITEAVDEQVRGHHSILTYVFFGLGVSLNGLFFYILKDWQQFLLLYILLPVSFSLIGLVFFIEETPFDLITNYSPEQSLSVLSRMAKRNGNESTHNITLQQLQEIKQQYQQNENKKHNYVISISDLFNYQSLRSITIFSIIIHIVTAFQFTAPELALKDYSLSIYANGMIIGAAELIGSILSYFLVDIYERKKIIIIAQIFCICVSVPVFVIASCEEACSTHIQILQTAGLFLFRFASTIAYNFFYMMQYQIYPNQIRGLALQVTCLLSIAMIAVIPLIITFFEQIHVSIIAAFGLSCFLIIALTFKMPETFGVPPPEMIEELKYEHHIHQDKVKNT